MLVFLILGLLLQAVIAPLMLMATVVLSFSAAMGVSALIFDHVFNFGNADKSFPLFIFVFLVALGIDYNIFLMTRLREAASMARGGRADRAGGHRRGYYLGARGAGWHVRGAGHAAVTFLAELGFAVAFGVLLDTLVVRSVLVTALNLDLGRWIWWPSKLCRQPHPQTEILNGRAAAIR